MAPLVLVVTPTMVKVDFIWKSSINCCSWVLVEFFGNQFIHHHCFIQFCIVSIIQLASRQQFFWFCWQVHRLQKDFSVLLENSVYLLGAINFSLIKINFSTPGTMRTTPKSLSVNIAWSLNISEVL